MVEAEEEVEDLQDIVEEPQDTAEDPPIPKIGEKEEMDMTVTIRNGMIGKQLVLVKARDHKKNSVNTVATVTHRKNLREESPQGTTQKTLKKRKGQEVPARRDTIGGIEA